MKDMERIFSSTFETNSDGFFAIDEPANAPIKIQPPPDLNSLGISNSSPESHPLSIDELAEKISHHVGINLKSIKSYFIGGETEALSRLQRKVSGNIDYVNTFRKPKTMSTNTDGEPFWNQVQLDSPPILVQDVCLLVLCGKSVKNVRQWVTTPSHLNLYTVR